MKLIRFALLSAVVLAALFFTSGSSRAIAAGDDPIPYPCPNWPDPCQ